MTVKAPIYSISRLRFGTDGKGITSLVAFMGCPLRCRHCINGWCHSDPSRARLMSPDDLYGELMIDDIYFQMTGCLKTGVFPRQTHNCLSDSIKRGS